jgi:hypothetical protein
MNGQKKTQNQILYFVLYISSVCKKTDDGDLVCALNVKKKKKKKPKRKHKGNY